MSKKITSSKKEQVISSGYKSKNTTKISKVGTKNAPKNKGKK